MRKTLSILMLCVVSAVSYGGEIDITRDFTGLWKPQDGEKVTQNSDGSISYETVAWGGLAAWYGGRDWSSYDELVFEFASATTVNTQILIQGGEEVKQWGEVGITSLSCKFAGHDLSSVSQVALQASDATILQIRRIYLVYNNQEGSIDYYGPIIDPYPMERVTDPEGFETAVSAVTNMRIGWNLGNTLDTHSGKAENMWIESSTKRQPSDYETGWGQALTTRALIHMFKLAGFNAIRVPVTWYPHFGSVTVKDGVWDKSTWRGYGINKEWMARVKEIVGYVLDEGMYCIVNVHHDTGAATTTWLTADVAEYDKYKQRYEELWTRIANEFTDYDDHLLFEAYNEMLDPYNSWCYASMSAPGSYDSSVANSAYNAINKYAQSFVDVVRATGGNNSRRNLIVTTYGACCGEGNWNEHLQDPLTNMKLPTDAVSDHIIFEVHTYPDIKNITTAKQSIDAMISQLQSKLVSKGAPLIFGEWGPSGIENFNYANDKDKLLEFATYFVEKTKAAGMGTFYWMSLSDGTDRAIPRWTQSELKDAIVKGYYGDEGYKYYKKGDVNLDGSIDISDVVAVINQMAGSGNYPYADVNSDGDVNISDVVAVINIMSQGY